MAAFCVFHRMLICAVIHRSEVNTSWKEKRKSLLHSTSHKCKCTVWVFCTTYCSYYAVSGVHEFITTANILPHQELLTRVSLVYSLDGPVEQIAASRLNLSDCFHSGPALLKVSVSISVPRLKQCNLLLWSHS